MTPPIGVIEQDAEVALGGAEPPREQLGEAPQKHRYQDCDRANQAVRAFFGLHHQQHAGATGEHRDPAAEAQPLAQEHDAEDGAEDRRGGDDAHGGRQRNLADRVVEGGQLDRRAKGARGMLQRTLGAERGEAGLRATDQPQHHDQRDDEAGEADLDRVDVAARPLDDGVGAAEHGNGGQHVEHAQFGLELKLARSRQTCHHTSPKAPLRAWNCRAAAGKVAAL